MPDSVGRDLELLQEERKHAQHFFAEHELRGSFWQDWHRDLEKLDAILSNDWGRAFPDESETDEAPKIANVISVALKDYSATASEIPPSLRCTPVRDNKPRAARREKIAHNYLEVNNYALSVRTRYFMDIIGAGAAFKVVLPGDVYPKIERRDPRHAYPSRPYDPDKPYTDMLFAYELPRLVLSHQYGVGLEGEEIGAGKRGELAKVLESYDGSEWVRVAAVSDGKQKRYVTLDRVANRLARLNVVVAAWPWFDGRFRGQFVDAFGPLQHKNRIQNLLLDLASVQVGASRIAYGISDPHLIGPGSTHVVDDVNAYIKQEELQHAHPQVFATLAQMSDETRTALVYPEARSGQVDQNIISAAGLQTLVGNLGTMIVQAQGVEGESLEQVLSLCFQTDELFHDERKKLRGSNERQYHAESYKPSEDISGDYEIKVDYPVAGTDQFGAEIRINAMLDRGRISVQESMELSPMVKDPLRTVRLKTRESLETALLGFVQQQAMAGNNEPMRVWLDMLARAEKGEEVDPTMEVAKLAGIPLNVPAGQSQQQPEGLDAFTEAASISRGGGPQANTTVPGQVNPLPPLSSLLAG